MEKLGFCPKRRGYIYQQCYIHLWCPGEFCPSPPGNVQNYPIHLIIVPYRYFLPFLIFFAKVLSEGRLQLRFQVSLKRCQISFVNQYINIRGHNWATNCYYSNIQFVLYMFGFAFEDWQDDFLGVLLWRLPRPRMDQNDPKCLLCWYGHSTQVPPGAF